MGRTASPATPGTDPRALEANTNDDAGDAAKDAPSLKDQMAAATQPPVDRSEETLEEKLERQDAEMAELRALVRQLGKNQVSAAVEPEELPTMKEVQKRKPEIPVLTEDGWYVPEVHPMDKLKTALR